MGADTNDENDEKTAPVDFIRARVKADLAAGRNDGRVHTRFPPEPNGYLHIGHAKAICLSFGIAEEFGGRCNLRMDDTNPGRENPEYEASIKTDIRWLGFDWEDRLFHASDYFEQLYGYAIELIEKGLAYVDSLSAEQIREYRGTPTEPGKNSPHRDRTVEENLDLFRRMRAGEFDDGTHVLRAKIDMAAPNLVMRDPTLYRIRKMAHHRTGDAWPIYPMYDFTHCLSDSIEGITHSLCTLEFENNREIYDWVLEHTSSPGSPKQIEFARLNLGYTVVSKRKLLKLVNDGHVSGWDDPRMPTLSGMRRRGVTPEAIRHFCDLIGVAKRNSTVDIAQLEYSLRQHLNAVAQRRMAVLDPLKVTLTNYPEGKDETLTATNNPENEADGTREVPFSRTLYIERDDFMEDPPKKFFRLAPGREVRLRSAYFITCDEVVKDDGGNVVELRCTYDPETRGGNAPDGRRVKATMHWVSAEHAIDAEVRLYDRLFDRENPDKVEEGEDFTASLNPDSLTVLKGCKLEPSLKAAEPGDRIQFERLGYFTPDSGDHTPERPVFNRAVTLRDTWARIQKRGG